MCCYAHCNERVNAMAIGWWKDEQFDCCILKLNKTWYATQHDVIDAQSHL